MKVLILAAACAALTFSASAWAQHAPDDADARATTGFGLEDGDLNLRRLSPDEVLQNFRAIQGIERRQQQSCATYGCIVLVNLTTLPLTHLYLRKSGGDATVWGKDWMRAWSSHALGPQHGIVLLGNSAAAYCTASLRFTLDAKGKPEDVEGVVDLCTKPGEVKKLWLSETKQ